MYLIQTQKWNITSDSEDIHSSPVQATNIQTHTHTEPEWPAHVTAYPYHMGSPLASYWEWVWVGIWELEAV